MSVGVFPIQTGKAEQVAADLEKVFGEESKTPSAGMFRFLPLENANAVLVITPQARYLDQIQQWLERIDTAGGSARLFSYELRYVKAKDLAERLAEAFANENSRGGRGSSGSLAPGATQMDLGGRDSTSNTTALNTGSGSGSGRGGLGEGTMSLPQRQSGNASFSLEVQGDTVGISAVEETNTLLVRSTPQAWRSIREVIEKLDVMPMQVHIEAQVAEVSLTGDLSYGVNWFFEQAVATGKTESGIDLPSALGRSIWGSISGAVGDGGVGWTFLGKNAAAVVTALDKVSNLRLLQTPSLFVRNNAEATLNVGTQIPINSVSVNTGTGGDNTYSQVQYLDTGVILKVRPRITRDGVVFLDIVQEVSSAGAIPAGCDPTKTTCNPPINTRKISTEAAVQSGDTIMLAGLITNSDEDGSNGVPGLSKIPVLGALFGRKTQNTGRSEVIVLLTPTIVRNAQESRNLTDEYSNRFRAMEPFPNHQKPNN
jgi:general secretion pathway protein D